MACCECCCNLVGGECCGQPGSRFCCKDDRVCCNKVCCPQGEYCCKEAICCPNGQACCGTPEEAECCSPAGECCKGLICCTEGETCCGTDQNPTCCPPGECCYDGVCEPCECELDEDCGEDECCLAGICGPCDECEEDEDCPEGQCCADGTCVDCECRDECPGRFWGICNGTNLVRDENGEIIGTTGPGQAVTSGPFDTLEEGFEGECPFEVVFNSTVGELFEACCYGEDGSRYCLPLYGVDGCPEGGPP
jgi:hypothetical protein